MLVKDLLRHTPAQLVTVKPDTDLPEAAALLSKYHIGLLVVTDYTEEVAGVLSERDIVTALGDKLANIDFAKVGELMTSAVVSIHPQNSLVDAVSAMNKHGIRHLVAMEENRPVGIISIRDVLQALASDLIRNGRIDDAHPAKEFVEALAAYQSADRLSIKI